MKKLLAILLILCLCLGALAACDEPSSGPSGIPPQGGETPGGETPGGGAEKPTPNPNARPTVTEEEFEAAKTTPANFTEWCDLVFLDGGDHTGSSVNYISTENGYTLVYYEEILDGETKDGLCSFFRDGVYWGGTYDPSAKKWRVYSHDKDFYTPSTLISDLPYSLSEMTYDEEKREYYIENEYAKDLLTEEQITAGWGKIVLRFEDGKIVYVGFLLRNSIGLCYCQLTMGNVGTTKVPTPPESQIIFDKMQEEVPPEGGGWIPLPDLDPDARTTVTEEEFKAATDGNFENYTALAEVISANGEKLDGYNVIYVNYVDGKLVFYNEEMFEGKKTGRCSFFHDGKYLYCVYEVATNKWHVRASSSYDINYPAEGMPFVFSDFTYDEAKGEYRLSDTSAAAAASFSNLTLRFEDGKLVKMIRPQSSDPSGTEIDCYYVMTIGNYGTTVVPTPPMEDIVFTSGSLTPPAPDSDARTTVTEEEFAATVEGNFENYSMWAEMIYSNGEKFDGYAVDYINYVDGKLVFYAEEMTEGKKTGHCAFFYDGKYWCGSYDAESGKWNVNSHAGYGIGYPAEDMPFALSDFTYDAEKGEYRMLMQGADQMMTAEQIAAGFGDLMLRFEDGKLVKMGRPMKIDATKGVQYYILTIGNYGTTVVYMPPLDDIVFNDNNNAVSPDHGDGLPH